MADNDMNTPSAAERVEAALTWPEGTGLEQTDVEVIPLTPQERAEYAGRLAASEPRGHITNNKLIGQD